MKTKVGLIVLVIMVVLVLSAGSLNVLSSDASFTESRKMLTMRNIGHQLLLSSNDSLSRVLPVRKLDEQNFLLEFENDFAFYPDSLVVVVQRILAKSDFPVNYAVHVMNCTNRSIVYGYEVAGNINAIPCRGRKQPLACYAVQITFPKAVSAYGQPFVLGFGFIGLVIIGWVSVGFIRKPNATPLTPTETENFIAIGTYLFYSNSGLLKHSVEMQELSRRETAVLNILAGSLNQLVSRDRLLKEVWEDEGIITGRSLDVFISKLRKKLRHDATIKLTNVHGKGYRLDV